MGVLDDYLVDPKISMLDKTRIQAQVLVPVMRALRAELGKEKADTIVRGALLVCDGDLDIAAAAGTEVSLDRAETIMQGAPRCTFRYKFERR